MTTIGPSLIIKGEVTSREDVTVQGKVSGKVSMEAGALHIAPNASVDADTQAGRLTIHGTFAGDIVATERVELTATANATGTLVAPAVVIQDGAVFNGSIEVDRRSKASARGTATSGPIAKAS